MSRWGWRKWHENKSRKVEWQKNYRQKNGNQSEDEDEDEDDMMTVQVNTKGWDELEKRAGGLTLAALMRVGGAVSDFMRRWFFDLDSARPNQMGGKRTHFWADVGRSVEMEVTSSSARVNINHVGLAQRWLGGTIRAGVGTSSATGGPTRFLAIPARTESYGTAPGEWKDLSFVPAGRGHPAMLIQNAQTTLTPTKRGGKRGFKPNQEVGGLAMFWLVKEVTQRPDPSVMPSEEVIGERAKVAVENYLATKLGGAR